MQVSLLAPYVFQSSKREKKVPYIAQYTCFAVSREKESEERKGKLYLVHYAKHNNYL